VDATLSVKRAAAVVNGRLGMLDPKISGAIVKAADEILGGKYREWFVVDVFQAGAGTSHNMNTNEVLANRAIELLGGVKGDYGLVNPNDHVNMAQSTNDVCPTAIRIAALMEVRLLLEKLRQLERRFLEKGKEFDAIVKSGRTHLMDAVPVRLGQEFTAYGINMRKHGSAIERASQECLELGIGGTATGTGLNSHPNYRSEMVQELKRSLGMEFRMAEDYFEAMQSLRPMVSVSQAIRNLSQDLGRIANDLRLMGSGPTTGLAEISLPAVQPGSSIMPGKVNPSIAEMVNMVCFQVAGCDTTVFLAAQSGQLELNVMMPVVAYNLLHAIEILGNAMGVFSERCVAGISANSARCGSFAEGSVSLATALNPQIGYAAAADVVKEAIKRGVSLRQVVEERKLLSKAQIDKVFDLHGMTEPGIRT
jgi:aspartate ammonia-lyase